MSKSQKDNLRILYLRKSDKYFKIIIIFDKVYLIK